MPAQPNADEDEDALPHVIEAALALGWVRLDATEWLATQVAEHANRNGGRSIREAGTRIGKQELVTLGITSWPGGHLSREAWDALTNAGRTDPVARFDATCNRAITGIRRCAQRRRDEAALLGGMFRGVRMAPAPAVGLCAAGMAMAGRELPAPPDLPFDGCDRAVCGCAWCLVSKFER